MQSLYLKPSLKQKVEDLAQRSTEIHQSIETMLQFQEPATNRRFVIRRKECDRRSQQESCSQQADRKSQRRCGGERRLPTRMRLQQLKGELTAVLNCQIALLEGHHALTQFT
jgi:hypothetical protein